MSAFASPPPSAAIDRSSPPMSPALELRFDADGRILHADGPWAPEVMARGPVSVLDVVHDHNHDLAQLVVDWVSDGGSVPRGIELRLRGGRPTEQAVVTAVPDGEGGGVVQFVPALPDPMRRVAAGVAQDRPLASLVDAALAVITPDVDGPTMWAAVHYGRDRHGRYREVVTSTGHDTFRRALEVAVAGDEPGPWDQVFEEERTVAVADAGEGLRVAGPLAGIHTCRMISLPGPDGDDIGCLCVWTESEGVLDAPDRMLLVRRVTAALGLAFGHDGGRQAMASLATRDGLTGLWNRQAFLRHLRTAVAPTPAALLFVDIVDFAAVNDWYGYQVGDDVLAEVARRLTSAMRPDDIVARMSGDQFAVLCPDVSSDSSATAIAGRLLGVTEIPVRVRGEELDLRIRVGVAVTGPERTGLALAAAAQRAAQQAGTTPGHNVVHA